MLLVIWKQSKIIFKINLLLKRLVLQNLYKIFNKFLFKNVAKHFFYNMLQHFEKANVSIKENLS